MVLLDINLPKHAMNYVKIRHCMYFIFLHVYKKNISFVYHMMSKNNVRFSMDGLFIQQRCHCQCHPFIQKYLSSMFCYILTLFEIEFVSHVEISCLINIKSIPGLHNTSCQGIVCKYK